MVDAPSPHPPSPGLDPPLDPRVPGGPPASTPHPEATPRAGPATQPASAWRALDPRVVAYWRVRAFLGATVASLLLGGAVLAGALLLSGDWTQRLLLAGIVFAIGLLALFLQAATWPRVRYRHARFRVQPDGLEIHEGVWWRAITFVPRSRVQHIDVQQGPLERQWQLGHLVVHTAGTISSSVPLVGLAHHQALALRDYLLQATTDPLHDAV